MVLVRVRWRDGSPTAADVMWARSVTPVVAAAPVHLAMKHLRSWEDFVLGWYAEDEAERLRRDAESRGHTIELLTSYDAYVEAALGCAPLLEEEIRVTFLPSFDCEGVFTARRTAVAWEFELRVARESIWYTRFSVVPFESWARIRRTPGVDVVAGVQPREGSDAERILSMPAPDADANRIGLDGMTVHVSSRLREASFDEKQWSPPRGTRVRAAVDLAFALSRDRSPEWWSDLRKYLH